MSLFKILRGASSRISTDTTPFHDGYAYFTPDDGGFYIDVTTDGSDKRIRINPKTEYDDTPTSGSENPVTSNGVYEALIIDYALVAFDVDEIVIDGTTADGTSTSAVLGEALLGYMVLG